MFRLLSALAQPEVFVALMELVRGDAAQTQLLVAINKSDLTSGTVTQSALSKGMTRLQDLGVVARVGSTRSPYTLTNRPETIELLRAQLALIHAAGTHQRDSSDALLGELRRRTVELAAQASDPSRA